MRKSCRCNGLDILVYWTGQPTECSMLRSVITAAIASCAEPLAYHESAIQYDPAVLYNQEHQPDMGQALECLCLKAL